MRFKLFASLVFILSLSYSQIPKFKIGSQELVTPIEIESDYSNGNWTEIGNAVGDRKIVLLGEFNHETSEVFWIKNDLIKYLHENHGFNAILFESGIGELIIPDQERGELSPDEMTFGFFGYWRGEEFRKLMEYVKEEDMNIAGFDVQRFGSSFSMILSRESEKLNLDSSLYARLKLVLMS